MQLKITVAATLVLALLVLVPGARADPMRARSQSRLGHWAGSPWEPDHDGDAIHSYHPWNDDWNSRHWENERTWSSDASSIGSKATFRSDDESGLLWRGSPRRPESEEGGQGTPIFSGPFPSRESRPVDSTWWARSDVASVPEPAAPLLLGVGLLGIGIVRRGRSVA
jgi:hypothetical protein